MEVKDFIEFCKMRHITDLDSNLKYLDKNSSFYDDKKILTECNNYISDTLKQLNLKNDYTFSFYIKSNLITVYFKNTFNCEKTSVHLKLDKNEVKFKEDITLNTSLTYSDKYIDDYFTFIKNLQEDIKTLKKINWNTFKENIYKGVDKQQNLELNDDIFIIKDFGNIFRHLRIAGIESIEELENYLQDKEDVLKELSYKLFELKEKEIDVLKKFQKCRYHIFMEIVKDLKYDLEVKYLNDYYFALYDKKTKAKCSFSVTYFLDKILFGLTSDLYIKNFEDVDIISLEEFLKKVSNFEVSFKENLENGEYNKYFEKEGDYYNLYTGYDKINEEVTKLKYLKEAIEKIINL